MSNRIELSDGEVSEAAKWLRAHMVVGNGSLDAARDAVYSIQEFINRARTSDPVGTIRRADTGVVALLTGVDLAAPWTVFSPCGNPLGNWTQEIISFWPVVYSPEES